MGSTFLLFVFMTAIEADLAASADIHANSVAVQAQSALVENDCEALYNVLLLPGIYQDDYRCETAGSILSSSGVEVAANASVRLRSPKIEIVGTFRVEKGGVFLAGTPWAEQLNPDLPGRFLFSHNWNNHASVADERLDGGLLMDIASGTTIGIPNTHWAELFEGRGYPAAKRNTALPVLGSSTVFLVQSEGSCGAGALDFDFCVFVQDYQGNILDFYHVAFGSYDHIRMSQDQSYLATFTDDGYLRLFERGSGQLQAVDSYSYTPGYSNPFAWLPDNRLIVASEDRRAFIFTHPASTQPDNGLALPPSVEGSIVEIEVSPSGQRFAFVLKDEANDNKTPWVVNTDGTVLRRLATSADGGGIEKFGQLQWSPDGRYILVKEPDTGGLGGNYPTSSSLYVIPTEAQGVIYKIAEDPQLRSPEVTRLKFWCDDPEAQECLYRYSVPADVYWVR